METDYQFYSGQNCNILRNQNYENGVGNDRWKLWDYIWRQRCDLPTLNDDLDMMEDDQDIMEDGKLVISIKLTRVVCIN